MQIKINFSGEGEVIWENSIETYDLSYVKQNTSKSLIYDTGNQNPGLHDNLEGWGGEGAGGGVWWSRGKEMHVYLWPIHVDVWQKPSQYGNYPPIKINTFKKLNLSDIKKQIKVYIW